MCFSVVLFLILHLKVCVEVITAALSFLGSAQEQVNTFLRLMLGLNMLGKEWEYERILAIAP